MLAPFYRTLKHAAPVICLHRTGRTSAPSAPPALTHKAVPARRGLHGRAEALHRNEVLIIMSSRVRA
jgi:hypothetical protein